MIIDPLDRLDLFDERGGIESDGIVSLRKLAQRQTVLITRIGSKRGLSAPISLESLKSQSLPLDRSDGISHDVDAVRVFLIEAVQSIVDLERREKIAIPILKDEAPLGPCSVSILFSDKI